MPGSPNKTYLDHVKASMMDSCTDFISIADKSRKIVYFNPAAYKMMGYGPDEKPNITTTEQLHAKDFDKFAKETIQPSVFAKGSWTGVSYITHKDGHPLTVEMTVFPLYGKNKEEFGTVAIMRDMNELTHMNERLKKSSELFQKVLDSTKIGIVLINMETHIIEMINQHTEELLQMSSDEIVGRKCFDILCHRNIDLCPHVNEQDKQVLVGERYLERKDGTFLPIIKTGTWIVIDDKKYLVDTLVDITIQKELEKKIQDAKTTAEKANHSKSEFLSRMSHEMRTPLNAIIGMTQISEKTDDIDKLKQCLDTIKLSSKHLLELINDVLDLSKIEEGKLELTVENFSVFTVVDKIIVLIDPKVKEKRIRLDVAIDPAIPHLLMGDPLRLSQVLLNFLSNAVKFTPEDGHVNIAVTINSHVDDRVNLHFSVTDTGIGITEEQILRLFNPFAQADGSITRKYGGTGLGLVISKRILNLMGSDIAVTSTYGQGSAFQFDLDLPAARKDDAVAEEESPHLHGIADIFSGKKALLVDDVDLNRIIAIELLAETGLIFDEACDGAQAVEKATRNTYDLILMDIQMPVLDGYAATKRIRLSAKPFSDVPIIAMSANVFKEDVDRSLAMGMNGHAGKPIDVDKLVATIYKLLNPDEGKKIAVPGAPKAVFKPDITELDFDRNYFDYTAALELHNNDADLLSTECHTFLHDDFCKKLRTSLDKKEYTEAEKLAAILIQKSKTFCLSSLGAYSGNVKECLERKENEFAIMYMADLENCYHKTAKLLTDLLMPGTPHS